MQKTKQYKRVIFDANILQDAKCVFQAQLPSSEVITFRKFIIRCDADSSLNLGEPTTWRYDTEEEFYADYRRDFTGAEFCCASGLTKEMYIYVTRDPPGTNVTVASPSRVEIERIFDVFERAKSTSTIPPEMPPDEEAEVKISPIVFIGHGRSLCWRDLKDHLHEKHGYQIQAYEIGARAGHAIRDILEDMLSSSSFAILVMTGEDLVVDGGSGGMEGKLRARQNVVHEAGLFQGRLGFARAIILLEEGTEEFSNIFGVQQIRFAKGNVREAYGEVLATLRREFQPK
jgi:hypothetical protein